MQTRALLALALALAVGAGCDTVDHVDIPGDLDGSVADGGTVPTLEAGTPTEADTPPDASSCVPDKDTDCKGKCGTLVGHCQDILDCGGCPTGKTCGGGGPNVCGTAPCVPSCTGKACGASDGCGGVCTNGSCGDGQRCAGGACVCDTTSCAGCCNGVVCMPGTSATACGKGGAICAACNGNGTCQGGLCTGCTPSCAGKACGASDGCGGTCMTGSCNTGQRCSSGTCVCDTSSCSGCCSGNTCLAGTTDTSCGTGGATCATCTAPQTCQGGSCRSPGPFLSDCTIVAFFGCATACPTGSTCVAKCGPGGNAGAESFSDSACTMDGQWVTGDQCSASVQGTYGRCCCQ